jgi:hypothetical protein
VRDFPAGDGKTAKLFKVYLKKAILYRRPAEFRKLKNDLIKLSLIHKSFQYSVRPAIVPS